LFDLHCHLLPGIDDGARTMEDALELARFAVANGITHAVVTPHLQPGVWNNDRARIEEVGGQFREALVAAGIPLQLGLAAEVHVDPLIIPMLGSGRVPFLGEEDGYKILLLEFPHTHIIPGSDKLIDLLLRQGIRPMIAHPERNGDVLQRIEKLRPLRSAGCLMQVTAASVAGYFGPQVRTCATQLLELGWVDVIATDAHNIRYRPPDLAAGRDAAARVVGEELAWGLVYERPANIAASHFSTATGQS